MSCFCLFALFSQRQVSLFCKAGVMRSWSQFSEELERVPSGSSFTNTQSSSTFHHLEPVGSSLKQPQTLGLGGLGFLDTKRRQSCCLPFFAIPTLSKCLVEKSSLLQDAVPMKSVPAAYTLCWCLSLTESSALNQDHDHSLYESPNVPKKLTWGKVLWFFMKTKF